MVPVSTHSGSSGGFTRRRTITPQYSCGGMADRPDVARGKPAWAASKKTAIRIP